MPDNLKLLTLVKRWSHHTESGGYDQLIRGISGVSVKAQRKDKPVLPELFRRRIWKRVMPSSRYVNFYRFPDMIAELRVFWKVYTNDIQLVHSLYAEDQLNLLLKFRQKLNSALVGSFHLPVESSFVQQVVKEKKYNRLRALDAAIVVSRSMVSDYEKWIGEGNVFYVPHGIDTNIFHPGKGGKDSEKLEVLIVGGHGRDWETALQVISAVRKQTSSVKFSAVVPLKVRDMFRSNPDVDLYTGISEEELIHLYRYSDLLFIPVQFASANNSLLESLACGTPVISTNTGGIPDYLDESCGWMFSVGDPHPVIELLTGLAEKRAPLRSKAEAARIKALEFDWEHIAEQVFGVYRFAYERWKYRQNQQ